MSQSIGYGVGSSTSSKLETAASGASSRAAALIIMAALGCSTADGLPSPPPPPQDTDPYVPPATSTGDAADSTGDDGDPNLEPEYGENCGADVIGWQTSCEAQSTERKYTDPLEMTAVTLEDELGTDFAKLCCEGFGSREEANGGCQELCMHQLCEEARQTHMWWALEVAPGCLLDAMNNCSFDVTACLTGDPHLQTLDDPDDLLDPLEYFLDIDCTAHNASLRADSGHWLWLEYPLNELGNDEPMCFPSSKAGLDPDFKPSQFQLIEGPGAQATFSWAFGDAHGIETTQELDIAVDYTLTPCDAGLCLELSKLEVSTPSAIVQGMVLGNLRLFLDESRLGPFELVRGSFVIPDQALRFTLTGNVDGSPLLLTGHNDGPVHGRVTPPTLTLTGLQFGYADELFQASLRLDVSATASASKPAASIRLLDAPSDCTESVTFEASSTDADGDTLSHAWWHPPSGFSIGPTLSAVLAPGLHSILLISRDASGRSDATGIRYDRVCL